MRLSPHLDLHPEETQLSFAARLAAFHGRGRLAPFVQDMRIDSRALATGQRDAVDRLAVIAGVDGAVLWSNTLRSEGDRRYRFRNEALSAVMLTEGATVACPACLRDDDNVNGAQPGQRVGRWPWVLGVVRTCPIHDLGLVARPRGGWDHQFRELGVLFPERSADLDRLVDDQPRRTPSPLQTYVVDRIAGVAGNAWLDGQTIDQVVRGSDMLGAVIEFGVFVDLKAMTSCDWDRAGRAGYPFMRRGPRGLRDAFDVLHERASRCSRAGGPQKVFGRLYQWLNFNTSSKDLGPIRDVLRDYILDTMEIDAGATVLGRKIDTRRRHSVASLARKTGEHPKTLVNLLTTHGLLPAVGAHRVLSTFDAQRAEDLLTRAAQSIPVTGLPEALGATRPLVRQLLDAGLIRSLGADASSVKGTKHLSVESTEAARFLDAIAGAATVTENAPSNHLDLATTPRASVRKRPG